MLDIAYRFAPQTRDLDPDVAGEHLLKVLESADVGAAVLVDCDDTERGDTLQGPSTRRLPPIGAHQHACRAANAVMRVLRQRTRRRESGQPAQSVDVGAQRRRCQRRVLVGPDQVGRSGSDGRVDLGDGWG